MPAQRSIMESRGLPSSNRHSRRTSLPAAAMTAVLMAMAAAVFCPFRSAAASEAALHAGWEDGKAGKELPGGSQESEEQKRGRLILEDPDEKTQYAVYEMAVGDVFSITFVHSVNQSPVIDYFEVRDDGIYGIKTVYYGFGAGVPTELGEGQTLTYTEDGGMAISGVDVRMDDLIYRVGTISDHILTLEDGEEVSLRTLCGQSARVGFRFDAAAKAE